MLLRTDYIQAPGHCRLCQSAVTPTIDTMRDYDSDGFGGVLYICNNCVATMADIMGWVHPSARQDFEDEISGLRDLVDQLEVESADLAAENETLKSAFAVVGPETPVKRGPGRPRKAAQ